MADESALSDVPSKVGVSIVLFHSDLAQLDRTLRSLAGQTLPPTSISIHVNEATVEELRALAAVIPSVVTVTHSSRNDGFAGGHNAALERQFRGGVEQVLVLNPDLALQPDALAELVKAHSRLPVALLGPLLLLADPSTGQSEGLIDSTGIRWTRSGRHLDDRQGRPGGEAPDAPSRVEGVSGAALLVGREVHADLVRRTGEFFDADFLAYREDAELAYRAALLGLESWLVPSAVGLHVRQLRGTSRATSPAVNRLGVRNRFLIAAKYGTRRPGKGLAPWGRDLVVLLGVLLRERSSWPGVVEAWKLRRRMRDKGRRVLAAAAAIPS